MREESGDDVAFCCSFITKHRPGSMGKNLPQVSLLRRALAGMNYAARVRRRGCVGSDCA